MSKTIEKIMRELDAEPTPGRVMAHVIRLERVVEKLSGKSLDELLEGKSPEIGAAPPGTPPGAQQSNPS